MRTCLRAAVTALLVAGLLCAAAPVATASRSLSVSGGARRGMRETERGMRLVLGGIEIICDSTMVKDVHSLIPKTVGALFGFVTDLRFANCRESVLGGAAVVRPLELPWHIQYQSFTGTLPRITFVLVKIVNARILIEARPLRCLYRGDIPIFKSGRIGANGLTVESLISLEDNQLPLFRALEGSSRCPSEMEFDVFYLVEPAFTLFLA
jgi:hypothetical protein